MFHTIFSTKISHSYCFTKNLSLKFLIIRFLPSVAYCRHDTGYAYRGLFRQLQVVGCNVMPCTTHYFCSRSTLERDCCCPNIHARAKPNSISLFLFSIASAGYPFFRVSRLRSYTIFIIALSVDEDVRVCTRVAKQNVFAVCGSRRVLLTMAEVGL